MSDIKPVEDQDAQASVEVLKGLLERAEAGEFRAIMVAAVRPDGSHDTAWSGLGGLRHIEAVGMLELLKFEILSPLEQEEV